MKREQAQVGTLVVVNVKFPGVPRGTLGVIDEDYGTGVMVAWNLEKNPLPDGYKAHDGKPCISTGILRDGFDKGTELQYLDFIRHL